MSRMILATGTAGRRRRLSAVLLLAVLASLLLSVPPASAQPDERGGGSGRPAASDEGRGAKRDLWQATQAKGPAEVRGKKAAINPVRQRRYTLDTAGMRSALRGAPRETAGRRSSGGGLSVSLPHPDGGFERFEVEETVVMEPGLAAKHPQLRTYRGRGIDEPTATIRLTLTQLGFQASVRSEKGSWYIDPSHHLDDSVYMTYYARDVLESTQGPLFEREEITGDAHVHEAHDEAGASALAGPEVTRRTYRLALLSDPAYANYFGGSANVTAAKVALMNRVNQIYEDESAIRLVLIADNDRLNLDTAAQFSQQNGPCGTAPCFTTATVSCSSATLTRNRIVIGQLVGASAFDVGHIIVGAGGGGIASLSSVGGNGKAQGCTGLPNPVGDYFAVDYVAHEIGHQFGGNHTFNGTVGNCSGGNRSAANSVEPGSGSSIMAYAGICGNDNLQPHTDPYWSQRSYTEIETFVTSNRAAINEVQNVSLRGWNANGQSFRLRYQGAESDPIVRGTNYTAAAIAAAVTGLTGGTVSVAGWGATTFNDFGFQVTWSGGNAQRDMDLLEVVDMTEGVDAFVGELAKGGPVDNKGHIIEASGNHAPVVEAPGPHFLPVRTPFALTAGASDADGDPLTYLWEQNDRGAASGTSLINNTKLNGPLFRVFGEPLHMPPYVRTQYNSPGGNTVSADPTRVFPDMEQILAGNTNAATGTCPTSPVTAAVVDCFSEYLPTAAYVGFGANAAPARLTFRATARDGNPGAGGIGFADTTLFLVPAAGPFLVTSLGTAGASVRGGMPQTITWDVAGTNIPTLAEQVKISLSTDGGRTYPSVLAASTANDGSHEVVLPNPPADITEARIKIEAVGNVFFDVNDADFTITSALNVSNDAPAGGALVQYSDALDPTVTVSAEAGGAAGGDISATASGLPAGLSLQVASTSAAATRPGTRTWTVAGTTTAAPGTYPVTVTVTAPGYPAEQTSFTIIVEPEDARVIYTGQELAATANPTSSTGSVLLSATVQDISVTADAAGDTTPGDIRNATVRFVDRDAGNATLCTAVVGAVLAGDTTTGSASCSVPVNLGNADALIQTVGIVVEGYYTRSASEDDALVTVIKPLASDFIAGGATLRLSSPAGSKAGDVGSRTQAAFNVKFNKKGTNLQGSVNVLTRRTEADGLVHTYQVKGNVLSSLTRSGTDRATLVGRASITDVTDPAKPVAIEGNATIQLAMTDNGEPGRTDTLSIAVLDKAGALWFGSRWDGTRVVEQALAGGNLRVR